MTEMSFEEQEALVAERDKLRAEVERLKTALDNEWEASQFWQAKAEAAEAREAALVDMLADIQPILINARGWCPKDSAAESDIIGVVKQINKLLIVKKKT